MTTSASDLPPLGPLRIFETAGRLGNFTHAGRELGLSQAAVSQQVKLLEEYLGVALFVRRHRSVALTSEGTRLLRSARVALELITRTAREIRRGQSPSNLRVAADLAFAHQSLMPRIADFIAGHPHIVPSIVASDYEADCLRDDVDVAILYGNGVWPGYQTRFLFGEEIFPVCSPAYREEHGDIDIYHLDNHVLLDLQGRWDWVSWTQWATEVGLHIPDTTRVREFNNFPLLTEATVNGEGVALGWKYLSDAHLDTGALIRLSDLSLVTDRGYYLVTRDTPAGLAEDFCEWLTMSTWPAFVTDSRLRTRI